MTGISLRDRIRCPHGGLAFLLVELGDKTMLATITLAIDRGLLGTWVGRPSGWSPPTHSRSPPGVGWVGSCRRSWSSTAAAFAVFGLLLIVQGIVG